MRVAMISQDFFPSVGGIQTYTYEIARRLAPRVERFRLIAPHASAPEPDHGFMVERMRGSSDALPATLVPHLTRLVRRGDVDTLLHVQWQTAPSAALLRRVGSVRRLAIAVHGRELVLAPLGRGSLAQRLYDRVRASVLQRADVVLPVSRYSASLAAACGVAPARLHVVANGVDAARFAARDGARFRKRHALGDGPLLLSVGRLVPRKGIDSVIDCMPAVLRAVPAATFVVVGGGPDRERLEQRARSLGVGQHVRFLGRVDDDQLADCYASCDAFVLAARDDPESVEGFGLVLLEASACGRPVIATCAGGMEDAVRDGESGLLVPAGNQAALTTAITRLLVDRALAARLGAGGLRHATEEATWERTAAAIYDALR